jgi:hypothetical protein
MQYKFPIATVAVCAVGLDFTNQAGVSALRHGSIGTVIVSAVIFSGQYCIHCNLVSAHVLENDEFQIVDGIDGCPFGSGVDQLGTLDWVWIVRLYLFQ